MLHLQQLHEEFSRQGVLISFNGSLSNSIIEEIGNAITRYLEDENRGKGTITDVFAVYIEQSQNIRNYIRYHDIDEQHRPSIMIISTSDGKYQISSGNSIRKNDVGPLREKLEKINRLDKEGLKVFYKEQRRRERGPEDQGAGLGLIDIARRCIDGLYFRFDPLDEEYDFFTLVVSVQGV